MDSPDLSRVTDRQLDAFLAVELFGFKVYPDDPDLLIPASVQHIQRAMVRHYSTDPTGALDVVKAMGEKGWGCDHQFQPFPNLPNAGHTLTFWCAAPLNEFARAFTLEEVATFTTEQKRMHRRRYAEYAAAPTFPRAVCEAAVAALWRESPAESRAILAEAFPQSPNPSPQPDEG